MKNGASNFMERIKVVNEGMVVEDDDGNNIVGDMFVEIIFELPKRISLS